MASAQVATSLYVWPCLDMAGLQKVNLASANLATARALTTHTAPMMTVASVSSTCSPPLQHAKPIQDMDD